MPKCRDSKTKSKKSVSEDASEEQKLKDVTTKSKGLKNKIEDMKGDDDEYDLQKVLMQHKKQQLEEFGSEKIMEKKGGLMQMLTEPFCPPSMHFHNPKGTEKMKQKKVEDTRAKRQNIYKELQSKVIKNRSPSGGKKQLSIDHLHNQDQYAQSQPRPILKVKSAAEQHLEETKGDDVLLSQDAMREILNQLRELQDLKKAFSELKDENERQKARDKLVKDVDKQKKMLEKSTNKEESKAVTKPKETKVDSVLNEDLKVTLPAGAQKSTDKDMTKSMSKTSLNKSGASSGASNVHNLKAGGAHKTQSTPIKVGVSKTIQKMKTVTEKQIHEVGQKLEIHHDGNKQPFDKLNTFKESQPVESEGEESSIYSEFNEDI